MEQLILKSLEGSIAAKKAFAKAQLEEILLLVQWTVEALTSGNKLLIFGNGGSAADAQHMAAEFVNRFLIDRPPLAALALTTDSSVLTSIGNDFSFDDIFSKQIKALGKPGDLALGISTSGNSANVINGIVAARELVMRTVALTGGSGGKLKDISELILNVPSSHTPYIQETHLWVEHLVCQLTDELLYGELAKTEAGGKA